LISTQRGTGYPKSNQIQVPGHTHLSARFADQLKQTGKEIYWHKDPAMCLCSQNDLQGVGVMISELKVDRGFPLTGRLP
jgi:hypothetical protein